MKRYLNPPDNRPRDDWGNPIGKAYGDKDWGELTPDEMAMDFEWKSDLLAVQGEEVSGSTFYQDYLFRELYTGELSGYKVLLTQYDAEEKSKVHKLDVDEIADYIHLNDVALSPCLFHKNWRRKDLMNYISAFVLDIDKLRPRHLQRFFLLFDEGRLLRPTFIANSGSGVHFYYLLNKMLPVDSVRNEANNLVATEIYKALYDDVVKKEKWRDAQRHWIGQDYRVINSKTKLDLVSQIFKVGDVYSVEDLIDRYSIKVDRRKNFASKQMIRYAGSIAKDLNISPPDYSNAETTYKFIAENKDEAYKIRSERRRARENSAKKKKSYTPKPGSWYKNTLSHMYDNTETGFRFSSLKALAIIAIKESVPKNIFLSDVSVLAAYWEHYDWNGDEFNTKNLSAIERLFDNGIKYSNTSSETLEEWLGYSFKRVGVKRNGRKQSLHLKLARAHRDILSLEKGKLDWREGSGRPKGSKNKEYKAKDLVLNFRSEYPEAKPKDCILKTGLSKNTVYKWWKA